MALTGPAIKAYYGGAYDDMPDSTVLRRFSTKFPQAQNVTDLPAPTGGGVPNAQLSDNGPGVRAARALRGAAQYALPSVAGMVGGPLAAAGAGAGQSLMSSAAPSMPGGPTGPMLPSAQGMTNLATNPGGAGLSALGRGAEMGALDLGGKLLAKPIEPIAQWLGRSAFGSKVLAKIAEKFPQTATSETPDVVGQMLADKTPLGPNARAAAVEARTAADQATRMAAAQAGASGTFHDMMDKVLSNAAKIKGSALTPSETRQALSDAWETLHAGPYGRFAPGAPLGKPASTATSPILDEWGNPLTTEIPARAAPDLSTSAALALRKTATRLSSAKTGYAKTAAGEIPTNISDYGMDLASGPRAAVHEAIGTENDAATRAAIAYEKAVRMATAAGRKPPQLLPSAAGAATYAFGHASPQSLAEAVIAHQLVQRAMAPEALSNAAIFMHNSPRLPGMVGLSPYLPAAGLEGLLASGGQGAAQSMPALPPWIQNSMPAQFGPDYRQKLLQMAR